MGLRQSRALWVDSSLFDIAFFNLIDNACKYSTSKGTVIVDYKVKYGKALIGIGNRGVAAHSMAAEDIFARGYRGKMATTVTASGHGMGLYVAKLIVAAHGGDIRYSFIPKSSLNVFTVSFPNKVD